MIAVLDYGTGNVGSIANMLRKCGLPGRAVSDPEELNDARGIIIPGVGAFDRGMRQLRERGFVPALEEKVQTDRVPTLGICLGMQLLGTGSEEGADRGLSWIPARSVRFRQDRAGARLTVPHMGWNHLRAAGQDPAGFVDESARFYFVHSYHLECEDPTDVLAWTNHGYEFPSAVRRGNVIGVQFHPEKSHRFGMALLKSFGGLCR